jgi:hypothetical protein
MLARTRAGRACVAAGAAAVAFLCTRPAAAAETFFQFDLRAGGYYAATGNTEGGAFLGGVHLGGLTWFGDDPVVGLLYMGGVELGPEWPATGKVTGTVGLSGAIGPAFLLSGKPRDGQVLSLGWAPRMFVNFKGKYVSSPVGVELAINAAAFKVPLWYLHTLDGTDFFGFGIGLDFRRF